jgi:TonB family protein
MKAHGLSLFFVGILLTGSPGVAQAQTEVRSQKLNQPVVTTAEIGYGFSRECPAADSEIGGVETNGRLLDKNGKVVGTMDYDHDELPYYFKEDRKAGIAGEMVLSLTFDDQGKLKEVHVLKSLSPHLDEEALETVRTWTFNLTNASSGDARHDLQLKITYAGECAPSF